MATKRTIKSEATTDGADPVGGTNAVGTDRVGGEAVVGTDRVGARSPSLRTRILQPRFKCVAHCNNISAEGNIKTAC